MIRKPYFSLFLLCLPLFSLCSSGNDDPAPAPAPGKEWLDPIRVATYNIQYDNSSESARTDGNSTISIRTSTT